MRIFYETYEAYVMSVISATVVGNRLICQTAANSHLNVTFHSSTEAREALKELYRNGCYDARKYMVELTA